MTGAWTRVRSLGAMLALHAALLLGWLGPAAPRPPGPQAAPALSVRLLSVQARPAASEATPAPRPRTVWPSPLMPLLEAPTVVVQAAPPAPPARPAPLAPPAPSPSAAAAPAPPADGDAARQHAPAPAATQPSPSPSEWRLAGVSGVATVPRVPADHAGCADVPHPLALRERGIEGLVQLRVQVGSDGRARQVQLLGSSGWRLFDEAALSQARRCRFRPAYEGGTAVESWVEFAVRFALERS